MITWIYDIDILRLLMTLGKVLAVLCALNLNKTSMPSIFVGVITSQGVHSCIQTTLFGVHLVRLIASSITYTRTKSPAVFIAILFCCNRNIKAFGYSCFGRKDGCSLIYIDIRQQVLIEMEHNDKVVYTIPSVVVSSSNSVVVAGAVVVADSVVVAATVFIY